MSWGLVTTVKAPSPKIMAYLAHHLELGAAQISLYFDDPEDPALTEIRDLGLPAKQVRLIACDAAHWSRLKARPERHQNRQSRNALRAYLGCKLDWLGHLDIDEFLLPAAPVETILSALPAYQLMCRIEPFEALHNPNLPDDIFTALQFRGALHQRHAALRPQVLGDYAEMLPLGLLSHAVGKVFFRVGIKGLQPRLHGAFIGGERLRGPDFEPRLKLLHFHAQDRAAWQQALPFRLTRGAYQYHPMLQAYLSAASPAAVNAFYQKTQMLDANSAAALQESGRLLTSKLDLRAKVARLAQMAGANPATPATDCF